MGGSRQTYEDWYWTGEQDFRNVGLDDYELYDIGDPREVLPAKERDLEEYKDNWMEQNEVEDGLDPNKAFERWKTGWLVAAREYLRAERVRPRHGTQGLSGDEWIAQRHREAVDTWGEHGDEAVERELFVRDALKDAAKETGEEEDAEAADELEHDPSFVRSDADPRMTFYSASIPGYMASHIVHVMTYGEFTIRRPVAERARDLLQQRRGTHWTVSYTYDGGDEEVAHFEEHDPIAKRNPPRSTAMNPRTKSKPLTGGTTLVVEEHPHGFSAWMVASDGIQRIPVSFGAYEPTDLEDALLAAERWLKGMRMLGDLRDAAPRKRAPTLNAARPNPSGSVRELLQRKIDEEDPADVAVYQKGSDGSSRADIIGEGQVVALTNRGTAIVEFWGGEYARSQGWRTSGRGEFDLEQLWISGTDGLNTLETEVMRGVVTNPRGKKGGHRELEVARSHRQRAEKALRARQAWRGPKGERWQDVACDEGCPGWGVGDGVQVCDECNATAEELGLPTFDDRAAAHLPAAAREFRRQTRDNPSPVPGGRERDPRSFAARPLAKGTAVELEHTTRRDVAQAIAMDHLAEDPRYYEKLSRVHPNPHALQLEDAKAKFEEFHAKKPRKIGEFHRSFSIPTTIGELGRAIHVLYRSDKKDPATGKQPKKPIDYIHEHYAGVKAYACNDKLEQCDVPDFITKCDALVLLGSCLGFCFEDDEGKHDAEGTEPLPELYATPCGKALIVVQDKKEVLAMIWGGGLGVWARGIDG